MATVTFKGNEVHTVGDLPKEGEKAPDFQLTGTDLSDFKLSDYKGKNVIINIFPSLDTSVCATSVRKFNEKVESLDNTVVISASRDLPFAHDRFCANEGLSHIVSGSELREDSFGSSYGVRITDGPLKGLFARSVVVVDEDGKVVHSELVPDIAQEPDYEAAMKAVG
jgi:thiol peroxidase